MITEIVHSFVGLLLVVILKMAELEIFFNAMNLITESPLSISCTELLVPGFCSKASPCTNRFLGVMIEHLCSYILILSENS